MQLNNFSKIIDPKLLKIWGLHLIIFYPICSFLDNHLEYGTIKLRNDTLTNFLKDTWEVVLLSPINGIWGIWERFPFFIFMAFGINIILNLLHKKKIFINYISSLLMSYLIVYLIHHYKGDIFHYIIPSLIITTIIQTIIFRKEIFKTRT